MTTAAKDAIASLRQAHDEFVLFVEGLTGADLEKQSGSAEWTVAEVLSHLGSAAEIGLNTLNSGKADRDASPAVWDRWNAMSPREKASSFVAASGRQVAALEALDDDELANKRIDLGFLPAPVDVAFVVGLRSSEVGLHGWDVHMPFDPSAAVAHHLVPTMLDQIPVFASFFAKPTGKTGRVALATTAPSRAFLLELREDGAALTEEPGDVPDAATRVTMPAEAFLRLTAGRLRPEHTPSAVTVDGELSLDDLRELFPGY
jgi:uncharacterized protein (TIGR03083 family)